MCRDKRRRLRETVLREANVGFCEAGEKSEKVIKVHRLGSPFGKVVSGQHSHHVFFDVKPVRNLNRGLACATNNAVVLFE